MTSLAKAVSGLIGRSLPVEEREEREREEVQARVLALLQDRCQMAHPCQFPGSLWPGWHASAGRCSTNLDPMLSICLRHKLSCWKEIIQCA